MLGDRTGSGRTVAGRTISRRDPLRRDESSRPVVWPDALTPTNYPPITEPAPPPVIPAPVVTPAPSVTPSAPPVPVAPPSPTTPTTPAGGGFLDALINDGFYLGQTFIPYIFAIGGAIVALWFFSDSGKRR